MQEYDIFACFLRVLLNTVVSCVLFYGNFMLISRAWYRNRFGIQGIQIYTRVTPDSHVAGAAYMRTTLMPFVAVVVQQYVCVIVVARFRHCVVDDNDDVHILALWKSYRYTARRYDVRAPREHQLSTQCFYVFSWSTASCGGFQGYPMAHRGMNK